MYPNVNGNSTDFLIIGAGLAGLSAAYHLSEVGCREWAILERSARAGGLCKSLKYGGGFTFDQSIHILYSSDPYASELIKKLLDGNLTVHKRESWVYSRGVLTPYPWQANTHGLPVEIVKECLMGVIKATYERNGKKPSVNFEEWCVATFGEGLAKHFMIPYNTKLWAVDLKEMTDAWIKDRVMTPLLDEVVEGALHRPEREYGPNSVFWYPEKGGIEALPRGFLPYLDNKKIFLNTGVEKIFWREKSVLTADGGKMHYKRLISSLPLPVVMKQLEPVVPQDLTDAAGSLEHNKVYAVNLAVKREKLSPYHWVYYPEEKYLLHRISFPGNFSADMTPAGWSSITVEISASKYRQIPPGERLIDAVITDLRDSNVIMENDIIELKSVLVLNPAYVVYNHNHRSSVNKLHQFLRENEIFPCGRFGEWEYLNMDHSILSGKKAADTVIKETDCKLN